MENFAKEEKERENRAKMYKIRYKIKKSKEEKIYVQFL